jgi:hypothetical protein
MFAFKLGFDLSRTAFCPYFWSQAFRLYIPGYFLRAVGSTALKFYIS